MVHFLKKYLQLVLNSCRAEDIEVPLDGVVHLIQLGLSVLQRDGRVVMGRLPVVELLLGQVADAEKKCSEAFSCKFLKK